MVGGRYAAGMVHAVFVRWAWVVVLGAVGVLAAGCTTPPYRTSGDALADLANRDLNFRVRARAAPSVLPKADASQRDVAVRALESVAWDVTEHATLRSAAIRALAADGGATRDRVRATAATVLPRERSREVVLNLCTLAADEGWTDLVPAIVQSYVRPVKGVTDEERAERAALVRLCGDPARCAFDAFVSSAAGPRASESGEVRLRRDAWGVLARLDADGQRRRAWVAALPPAGSGDVEVIQRMLREWRTMPLTPEQLDWATSLAGKPQAWADGAAALASLGATEPVEMRHASAAVWAGMHAPELLAMSREQVLERLTRRLEGRPVHLRTNESADKRVRERLSQVQDRLTKADLIQIIALDEAARTPAVVRAMFGHAELDRQDETTEYGGLIEFGTQGPRAVLYIPRMGERAGDSTFVASAEMIAAGDQALGHYHFHVQSWRQVNYAGPSEADLAYATRFGRACLVLTGIREGVLAVDYYHPGEVVVDLGTIELPGR